MITNKQEITLPYLAAPALHGMRNDGHQIIAIKLSDIPISYIATYVTTGAINETPENNGVSHFLEHLLFKASKKYGVKEIDRILENCGGMVNAGTSEDYTTYYITLKTEYLGTALDIHFDMIFNSLLPEDEIGNRVDNLDKIPEGDDISQYISRERAVVIEEIKMGDDNPIAVGEKKLDGLVFSGHPYERTIIGTKENIATITREAIENYYTTWYKPSSMISIIVSDLAPEKSLKMVDAALSAAHNDRYQDSAPILSPAYDIFLKNDPKHEVIEMETASSYLFYGIKIPKALDIKATVISDMISLILGNGQSSRFTERLVEGIPNSPFIDMHAAAVTRRDTSNFIILALVNNERLEEADELIKNEIKKIAADDIVTQEEFERSRTRLLSTFATDSETIQRMAKIVYYLTVTGDANSYNNYLHELNNITLDDVNGFIRKYMLIDGFSSVTIKNKGKEMKSEI